ncbi:hypothetical protein J6G99_01935 [bacterium]|nr:hypothetical protein [bacterium]
MNLVIKNLLLKTERSYLKTKEFFSTNIRLRIKSSKTLERSPKVEKFTHNNPYCYSCKTKGGGAVGSMPDYYTTKRKVHIDAKPEYWTIARNGRGRAVKCDRDTPGAIYHPSVPAHDEIWKNWSDYYLIQKIFGDGQGAGTAYVRGVVLKSLKDNQTRGKVLLEATCIDGKTHPAGFYYKLGFRHTNEQFNIELEKWLKEGGKKENAPWCPGNMYLPRENIMRCLNYGNTTYSLKGKLLIKGYMLRNKILYAIDNLKSCDV